MKQCPDCRTVYPSTSTFCFVDGGVLAALPDPRIGSTLAGRYVIDREIGAGGMATVYAARHLIVDKPCAIKILAPLYAEHPVLRERFVREARHAQRIAHPNVIEIFDHGETDDHTPFLVMELLLGRSLADVLNEGPLPIERALPVGIEMTRALARAHDFEVIHRDLKPENVFLLAGDHVKLLDFGIARCAEDARLTNRGEVFGTPQYMAPERAGTTDAGPPADLYAFGMMLFEMIAGRLPFEAHDAAAWLVAHLTATPAPLRDVVPSAPAALDRLIHDLLAKSPADRPPDARHVLDALTAIAEELGVAVPPEPSDEGTPPSTAPRSAGSPWRRRLRLFEQMLARAYPAGAAAEPEAELGSIRAHIEEMEALQAAAFEDQQRIEAAEREAREKRVRLGRAMDALAADASRQREEARRARAEAAARTEEALARAAEVKAEHREVVLWEGRSAFIEPHRELAAAYRRAADRVDAWWEARQRSLEAEREATEKERAIKDVNFQIRSLRESLGNLERAAGEERRSLHDRIADAGARAHDLEGELLQIAARFCEPLRSRAELGPLFAELERGST